MTWELSAGLKNLILSEEREKAWEAWCNSHSVGQTCLKFLNAQPLWELQAEKANFHRNNDDAGVAYWVIPRVHIRAFLLTHGPSYLHFSIIKPSFRRPIFRFFFPVLKWRNLPYGNTSIVFTHTCLADNNWESLDWIKCNTRQPSKDDYICMIKQSSYCS